MSTKTYKVNESHKFLVIAVDSLACSQLQLPEQPPEPAVADGLYSCISVLTLSKDPWLGRPTWERNGSPLTCSEALPFDTTCSRKTECHLHYGLYVSYR